ncbi:MAG: sn-glycerol-3-phosphate ABC transporter ATP-binding protein UgpC [Bacillota bacterium]
MASVTLKGVKKVYPCDSVQKKAAKKGQAEKAGDQENRPNLQITEQGVVAVQDFDLEVEDKEFVVLVGPSGCGKSTTLRMIAGLEEITDGEIYIGDKLVNDAAPKDRDIAMVFQNYALYPHMTAYENMAFGLKLRKVKKEVIHEKVLQAAEILSITELLERKPKALSGGQRQRIAIGRAIVREPKVFLMDEPLSNLDAKLRNQMRAELIKLRQRIDTTFIYVTHDQTEAMTLGDRIVVMKDGFVQQIGTPQQVFNHPANLFVACFIGTPQMNCFQAKLVEKDGGYAVEALGDVFELEQREQRILREKKQASCDVVLGVRPEHIALAKPGAKNSIKGRVELSELMGSEMHLHVDVEGTSAVLRVATPESLEEYCPDAAHIKEINFTFIPARMHLFDPASGMNIVEV